MAMGAVDTMFVGRVSANALAAVAIGNAYFWFCIIIGFGILFALDPLITQAVGADDQPAIARAVQRGLLLAVVLAAVTGVMMLPGTSVLRLLRQPPEIIPGATGFVRASIGGVLPLYAFIVIRLLLQAHHRTTPLVIAIIVANLVNIGLNYVFVFGHLGFSAMGPAGAGWASTVSRWVMCVTLAGLAWPDIARQIVPWRRETFAIRPLARIFGIGIPICIQYELEVNAFAFVAVMMGWIGATAMAGHQIALNISALTFMVPLGVSAAGAVHVGRAVGAGDMVGVRRSAGAALAIGIAFMSLSAVVMLTVPRVLARAYTAEAAVLATAVSLLPLAGLFQVFDGIQVVSVGILRGTGDTRTPMIINVLGFWLIGVPVSWYLGMRTSLGPRGLWIGFVFGLAAVAMMLLLRVRARLGQVMRRTLVDERPLTAREAAVAPG
jgi:MATE family multidrug resistance protein